MLYLRQVMIVLSLLIMVWVDVSLYKLRPRMALAFGACTVLGLVCVAVPLGRLYLDLFYIDDFSSAGARFDQLRPLIPLGVAILSLTSAMIYFTYMHARFRDQAGSA